MGVYCTPRATYENFRKSLVSAFYAEKGKFRGVLSGEYSQRLAYLDAERLVNSPQSALGRISQWRGRIDPDDSPAGFFIRDDVGAGIGDIGGDEFHDVWLENWLWFLAEAKPGGGADDGYRRGRGHGTQEIGEGKESPWFSWRTFISCNRLVDR